MGCENSLPALTEILVPWWSGIVLIGKGQTAEGIALVERAIAFWEGAGAESGFLK
jgi:hypothetical protein